MRNCLAAVVLAALSSLAHADLAEVTQVRGLLLAAVESGQASAWMSGPMAQQLKSQINAPAGTRVLANVTTLKIIRPGCRRLNLELSTPGFQLQTRAGGREDFRVSYAMNLCSDGRPPESSNVGSGGAS